jgi:hypothetical protein
VCDNQYTSVTVVVVVGRDDDVYIDLFLSKSLLLLFWCL